MNEVDMKRHMFSVSKSATKYPTRQQAEDVASILQSGDKEGWTFTVSEIHTILLPPAWAIDVYDSLKHFVNQW